MKFNHYISRYTLHRIAVYCASTRQMVRFVSNSKHIVTFFIKNIRVYINCVTLVVA